MAEIQHNQIKTRLNEKIVPQIDGKDLANKQLTDRELNLLSRAVAFAAIKILSQEADADIAKSIVDGQNDSGIDAIYYSNATKTLYLCQSKWSENHSNSIDQGSVLKFVAGIKNLISGKKERFNSKIQERWELIEDALTKVTTIRVIVAFSGSGAVADPIKNSLTDFLKEVNDTAEMFFLDVVDQRELFRYFASEAAPPKIDLQIKLTHFGKVDNPLEAIYGQISVADIAEWYQKYGNRLFAGNIRNFLGLKSEVNSDIVRTLTNDPSRFWYFNNGITIIAESQKRQALGSSDRSVGIFDCKNISIVNGAQTVGSIGRALSNPETPAAVQARIIIIDDPNSQLWQQITKASNTQNKIDARNFVALDPQQERIRVELLLERVNYEYREGESLPSAVDSFDFTEAVVALACASADMSMVATAKGYVGGLYSDTSTTPYKALFNAATVSKRVWKIVQLCRKTDSTIKMLHDPTQDSQRKMVVHGNRFLTHCVLHQLRNEIESDASINDQQLNKVCTEVFHRVLAVVFAHYDDAYPAPLYKNVGKCTDIFAKCGF